MQMFREKLSKFRVWLEEKREKSPKLFDSIFKIVEAVWIILTTFTPVIVQNKYFSAIFICVSFVAIYTTQWALLSNENDRRCTELNLKCESQIAAIEQQKLEAARFSHSAAHTIKNNVANIPHQELKLTRDALANYLKEGLNTLESILTKQYGTKVSASVKLGDRQGKLKTYGRGKNNIESRNGSARVNKLDRKSYTVTSNYAYSAIFNQQLRYFADGDLSNLTMQEKNEDKFFWEYKEPWENYFKATIVIPIRCQSFQDQDADELFEVLGLVCVDANAVIKEWTDNPNSYGYEITAFFADSLYNYIAQYLQQQRTKSGRKARGSTKSR